MLLPDCLKGGTVRPYGRAHFFTDCARFGFLNTKCTIYKKNYLFWVLLYFFLFWTILFAQNFLAKILAAQKNLLLESLVTTEHKMAYHSPTHQQPLFGPMAKKTSPKDLCAPYLLAEKRSNLKEEKSGTIVFFLLKLCLQCMFFGPFPPRAMLLL